VVVRCSSWCLHVGMNVGRDELLPQPTAEDHGRPAAAAARLAGPCPRRLSLFVVLVVVLPLTGDEVIHVSQASGKMRVAKVRVGILRVEAGASTRLVRYF